MKINSQYGPSMITIVSYTVKPSSLPYRCTTANQCFIKPCSVPLPSTRSGSPLPPAPHLPLAYPWLGFSPQTTPGESCPPSSSFRSSVRHHLTFSPSTFPPCPHSQVSLRLRPEEEGSTRGRQGAGGMQREQALKQSHELRRVRYQTPLIATNSYHSLPNTY